MEFKTNDLIINQKLMFKGIIFIYKFLQFYETSKYAYCESKENEIKIQLLLNMDNYELYNDKFKSKYAEYLI